MSYLSICYCYSRNIIKVLAVVEQITHMLACRVTNTFAYIVALTPKKTMSKKRIKYVILLVLSGSHKVSLCIRIGCAAPVTVHWPCARVDGACNADFFSKLFLLLLLFPISLLTIVSL